MVLRFFMQLHNTYSPRHSAPIPSSRPLRSPVHRRKYLLFRLVAILIGLLVAFPICEIIVRITLTLGYVGSIQDLPNESPHDLNKEVQFGSLIEADPNPKLVFHLRPNIKASFQGVKIETNAMGFRDDAITTSKPPGTLRVVGVGDSTMFGFGVPQKSCYLELLETECQALLGKQRRVEFVNTGVPTYTTTQEVESFLKTGLRLAPDAVIIQFDRNDLMVPLFAVKPDYLHARHLFTAHWRTLLSGAYSDLRAIYLIGQEDRFYDTSACPDAGWDAVVRGYRRLANVCREHKIPIFGLLVFEDLPGFYTDGKEPPSHKQILELWRELGITAIQALPQVQTQILKDQKLWYQFVNHPEDLHHPNPVGQALIAQAALPVLRDFILNKAGLQPQTLEQYPLSGNIILRQQSGVGLYPYETVSSRLMNWTDRQAHFHFIPAGRKMFIPIRIGHPDVSVSNPVNVHLRIDGIPTARHPVGTVEDAFTATTPGELTRSLDISGLDGCPLELTVNVNRTFRTATDQRPRGVGLGELSFTP